MPRHTTFGFEAEWQTNAQGVLANLCDRGYAGDRTLHGYHCDCEDCAFGNGWAYRGQTDSSCSGEIISDIFSTGDNAMTEDGDYDHVALMHRLSECALDADAEPGLNSAFHVHVAMGGQPIELKQDALWEFVRWEPVLARIAGGRWSEQRPGMNATTRSVVALVWNDYREETLTTGALLRVGSDIADLKRHFLNYVTDADRHSNLNTRTRARTWEFRLWNSTRSAWRMEMFCALSVALTDPEVIDNLANLTPPERLRRPSTGIDNIALAVAIDDEGNRLAELLQRQAHYLDNRAGEAPASLTAL